MSQAIDQDHAFFVAAGVPAFTLWVDSPHVGGCILSALMRLGSAVAVLLMFAAAPARAASMPGAYLGDLTWPEAEARLAIRAGARRIVFLNTSISKAGGLPLSIVARDLRADTGVPTLVVSCDDLENGAYRALETQERGGHADEIETSIHLLLQPALVRMDLAVTDYGRLSAC